MRQIMRGNGIFHRFHRKTVTAITTLKRLLICLKDALTRTVSTRLGAAKLRTFEPKEGWLYLASVIDHATRHLVGYSFGNRMTLDLVTKALKKAYENELPNPGCIFHSDQGSQYCSVAFQAMLLEYNMRSSMSRGQCWDNAPAKSFWATLKCEVMPLNESFNSRSEVFREVQKWLYHYNGSRAHSKLGGLSPNEFFDRQFTLK